MDQHYVHDCPAMARDRCPPLPDREFRKGIGFVLANMQIGKAEFYRRAYGGRPDLSIDTSAFEVRMMAHLVSEGASRGSDPEFPRPSSD